MKFPVRPSRRALLRAAAILLTLGVLLWAAAGWWAAAAKTAALRAMEESGRIISVTGIPRPLPPDDLNFAMLPMLVALREETPGNLPEDAWSPKITALGEVPRSRFLRDPRNAPPHDFGKLLTRHGFPENPADALREFDSRHAPVLDQFRVGLPRPHAVRPHTFDFADPSFFFTAAAADTMALHQAAAGIAFRARLAIAARDPDAALESILIAGRLSELVASGETILGILVAISIDSSRALLLADGIERQIWDENHLDHLGESFPARDLRPAASRALNTEGLLVANFIGHAKRDRSLRTDDAGLSPRRLLWHLVPGSWFDLQAARTLESTEASLQWFDRPDPLQALWNHATLAIERDNEVATTFGVGQAAPILVRKFVHHAVLAEQARVAILLARHRLDHGKYPPDLDSLDSEPVNDPLNGNPFIYRSDGDTFTLYSPGPDGIDNGGTRHDPRARLESLGADWVW